MANNLTPMKAQKYTRYTQAFLNKMLVCDQVGSTRLEEQMTDAYRVNLPKISNVRVADYTPLTDVSIPGTSATNEFLEADLSKVATFAVDGMETAFNAAKYEADLTRQAAHEIKNYLDQAFLNEGVDGAASTVAGGTLAANTIFGAMTDCRSKLARKNGADGPLAIVLDPERIALLAQYFASTGNSVADLSLRNGFAGSVNGFQVYESNNLPSSVALTVDTQPTAGDTLTVLDVTFTFTAAASASAAGEIALGANLAATQANIIAAINGTGTPGASTYIDVSADDRSALVNSRVAISAFSSDIATVTANDKIDGQETFTAGTNVFGTETTTALAMRMGAIDMARLRAPRIDIREESKNLGENYFASMIAGVKLFSRNANRVCKLTLNA